MKTFIVAEAGVNHNGSLDLAKRLVDVAFEAQADAIKFQSFNAKKIVSEIAPSAKYQQASAGNKSQYEILKGLELSYDKQKILKQYCDLRGILFLSSPFDVDSADMLYDLGMKIFKIASGEITNYPLLKKVGGFNGKIILSTGMSEESEIQNALTVLVESGSQLENITVLQCNTQYPAPFYDVHLRAMRYLADKFNVKTGYSDHTLGIEIPIAAVALGAHVIEKHFTLSREMRGPDHAASLEPQELKQMIRSIRYVEKALGNYEKKTTLGELENRPIARKSIHAATEIKKDDIFSEKNLTTLRPGTGVNPMKWESIIGKKSKRNYHAGQIIDEGELAL